MPIASPSRAPAIAPMTGAAAAGTRPASSVAPAASASTDPATCERGPSCAQSRTAAAPPTQASTARPIVIELGAPNPSAAPASTGATSPPQKRPPLAERLRTQPTPAISRASPSPNHQFALGVAACARRDMNSHRTRPPPAAGNAALRQDGVDSDGGGESFIGGFLK